MRLPAWLDVTREGGVLELERALREYRTLRRLVSVSGDWRARARLVADVTASVRGRTSRVEQERAELLVALCGLRGKPAPLEGLGVAVPWSTWGGEIRARRSSTTTQLAEELENGPRL